MTTNGNSDLSRRSILRRSTTAAVGLSALAVATPATAQDCESRALGTVALDDPDLPIRRTESECVPSGVPGTYTLERVSLSGPNADEFRLEGVPSLPVTLGSGECLDVQVVFDPTSPGEKAAVVTAEGECVSEAFGASQQRSECVRYTATVTPASGTDESPEPPADPPESPESPTDPPEEPPESSESPTDPPEESPTSPEESDDGSTDPPEPTLEEPSVVTQESTETTSEATSASSTDSSDDVGDHLESVQHRLSDRLGDSSSEDEDTETGYIDDRLGQVFSRLFG
ncbi:dihydrolipoyllysine-residue succinyltransferase component of 2-oxoglutarate dehydrogenase complex [Natronobiforma cellulositropha]|uniref:hypothetical protein n=1 Tax=Natronobiforma cellulositropha TaxID=1679076 RepID=UPI0021D5904A|nr:hypothetical protein [Natronobiforma cellulositropha]